MKTHPDIVRKHIAYNPATTAMFEPHLAGKTYADRRSSGS